MIEPNKKLASELKLERLTAKYDENENSCAASILYIGVFSCAAFAALLLGFLVRLQPISAQRISLVVIATTPFLFSFAGMFCAERLPKFMMSEFDSDTSLSKSTTSFLTCLVLVLIALASGSTLILEIRIGTIAGITWCSLNTLVILFSFWRFSYNYRLAKAMERCPAEIQQERDDKLDELFNE